MFSVCGLIIGTKSMSFALLSHTVAKEMELNNQLSTIDKIAIFFDQDLALILSAVLAISAISLGVSAFLSWSELNFGDFTDRSLNGLVLGSLICFVSAGQLLLNGFFWSFLKYSFFKNETKSLKETVSNV